jgi:AmiR/NasT family two-component response regulator
MDLQKDLRVLIAEDEPLVGEMIKGILKELKYSVVGQARNGQQAITMTESLKPDVVLMDIQMPDMDGLEATLHIYKFCPTPVVILTAYDSPELILQASEVGVGAYLLKPPKAREVERAITIALARFGDLMSLRYLNAELEARNAELREALEKVKALSGLLPICSHCKKIRDDAGYWQQVEVYIRDHSEAEFSHGICPDCMRSFYPDYYKPE